MSRPAGTALVTHDFAHIEEVRSAFLFSLSWARPRALVSGRSAIPNRASQRASQRHPQGSLWSAWPAFRAWHMDDNVDPGPGNEDEQVCDKPIRGQEKGKAMRSVWPRFKPVAGLLQAVEDQIEPELDSSP